MGKSVPFKFFEGLRLLSGVDLFDTVINGEIANQLLFQLDGKTYLATENTEDGLRSSLKGIEKVNRRVKNQFDPVYVEVEIDFTEDKDLLCFYRYKTRGRRLVLMIGTDNCADRYTQFVGYFDPKALGRKKK